MRVELPPNLTAEEERAVRAAVDQYLWSFSVQPSPWTLAGRAEGAGLGALQIRYQSRHPWGETRLNPYTRRGMESRMGRGDTK